MKKFQSIVTNPVKRIIQNKYWVILIAYVLIFLTDVQGQTTLLYDNFNASTGGLYDVTGAIGTSTDWFLTRSGNDWGARIPGDVLDFSNFATGGTGASNGWVFGYRDINALSGWNTTLSSNTGPITWEFNMRQIRTDPAGFAVGSYGVAFILAGTSTTASTAGSGYAIVLGQSGATDPVRLVSFNGGLQGALTNIITSNTSGLTDFGNEYLSVRVTYAPSTNTWQLFLRLDGTTFGSITDPATGTLTSQGTAVNSTYTSTAGMRYIGGYWQGSTASNQTAFFDNVYLKGSSVPPTVTTNATVTAITASTASSGGEVTDQGSSSVTARGVVWGTATNPILPGVGNTTNGSGLGTFTSSLTTLTAQTQYFVRAYATNSQTAYGGSVSFYTLSNAPTAQAANLTASALSSSQINLAWEPALFPTSGATVKGYVLVRATQPAIPTFTATNGQAPAAGVGAIISSSILDPVNSFANSGLAASTTYNYLLVPYCWDGTNAATYHYLTLGAQTATATTSAPPCTLPTTQATNLTISTITSSSMQLTWTNGNGDRSMVIVKQGSAVNEWPALGTAYTANNQFASGANLGSFNYVCHYAVTNSVTIGNLTPGTTYHVAVITANNTGNCYLLSGPLTGNATTSASTGFIETFEPGTKNSYTNGNVVCNTGLWNFNNALIGTAVADKKNNLKSARIQTNGSIAMLFDKPNGAGIITIRSAVYDNDAASTWRLEVSNNSGASYDAYLSSIITTSNTILQTQSFAVNVSGDVRLRIVKLSGSQRLNFDDIEITDFIPANIITTGVISGSPFCISDANGIVVAVPFTSTGTFNAGNVYTAQLSDASGSFSIPVNIGTTSSVANSGTVTAQIPAGTFTGSSYRIRIVSSDPEVTGNSNNSNLTVYLNTPDVSNLFASIASSTSLTLNWTNPLSCFDQILVVAKASTGVTATPSGDGTAYTANSVFSSGGSGASLPANEFAIYKGVGNSVTVTGLTSGTTYFFEVFVRNGTIWSPGVLVSAEPVPVQIGDFRSKQLGNYNAPSTWETYNGSIWVNASTWPNSAGVFPGTVNVTISHSVTLTTSVANQPINNLTISNGGKFWTNDSTINGNRYVTVFGDIFCSGTGTIGNAFNKYDNISFNIEGATTTINGSGGFYASRLRKSFTNNSTTHLIIAKNIALKFNSGTAGASGTVMYNNASASTFNITINPNTVVDLLLSTGSSGNISIDGPSGEGNGECGGTLTVNGTLNIPGTLFLLTNNASLPVVYQIGNTGIINCVNVCTGNTAVTSPINLSNGSHTGTSTLRILNGGRLNMTGGNPSDANTYNKPFSLRSNTGSPFTYVAGLGTSNTTYDFQVGSIVEYSNTSGTLPVQCATLTYSNIVFSNGGIKAMNTTLNVNRDLSIFSPAVLNTNNNNINIGGDWINYGSVGYTEGTSTVTFNGSSTQTIISPSFENFHNLNITNASTGGVIAAANLNIANELDLSTSGRLFFGATPITVSLTNMADASNSIKGTGTALIDLSSAGHTLIIGCQSPAYSGQFNAGATSLVSYNRNSATSGTSGNQTIITNVAYANLILTGSDNKLTTDHFTVSANLNVDGNTTVLQATTVGKNLTIGGDLILTSNSTMHPNCFDHLAIITQGDALQHFNGGGNVIRCFSLQSVKSIGGIQLNGPLNTTTVQIKTDLLINYTVFAQFTDHENLIQIGDDAELGGTQANYTLTGTLQFNMAGTAAATDAHISNASGNGMPALELNNLNIEPVSGAEVSQLNLYPISGGQVLVIKNNLEILNTNATGTLFHPRSNTIRIGGNWTTYGSAGFEEPGSNVEFNSIAAPQSLFSANKEIFDQLVINTSQALLLNAPVEVSGNLILNNGKIQTGVHTLHHLNSSPSSLTTYNANSYVNGNLRRSVNATGSYAFPVGDATHLQDIIVTLNSSVGMSNILAYFNGGLPATLPSTSCIINSVPVSNMLNGGYWTVEPNAYSSVNYNIELRQRGFTNFSGNATMLGIIKRTNSSSPWQGTNFAGINGFHSNATQTLSGGVATAIRTSVTSFSDFGIGFNANPLPVQLTSFDATQIPERRVLLAWQTSSELNSAYYEVERSVDAIEFHVLGRVSAAGYSTSLINYQLTDEHPYNGLSYYRLKQVDVDGSYTYSVIRKINLIDIDKKVVQIYPNPVHDVLFISGVYPDLHTQFVITDISGRVLISHNAYHLQQIPLGELPAGQYLLKYINREQQGVVSFIKNK
ncbi:hypothetical protein LBMAG25_02360 [Bacteroidota bacterium]|nr:hypothetical protein LBMAG25_02360 [Bacteroidota bacterium]